VKVRAITGTALAATVASLVLAATAGAATPRQIYADWANNGRIDGNYSVRDLQAARKDATLQGYGKQGFAPSVQQKIAAPQGVKGVSLATTTTPRGTLPFTGADLMLFAAAGLVLLALGAALRRNSRADR
jgi:hypothetical protein